MEKELQQLIAISCYSDGTGWSGNEFTGLGALFTATPAIGTVGGINRADYSWWRNQYIGWDSGNETLLQAMNRMDTETLRGNDSSDIIIAGKNMFLEYKDLLQANQRFVDAEIADAGFRTVDFQGTPVILDKACGDDDMYFINSDYLKFRYPAGWWFKTMKPEQVPAATYKFTPCFVAGNFTCSSLQRHGLISAV